MSYTTNSTANRLKINKGWKNPSFPETLPFYSRDNVFFFKLYLFLKAYFTLKKTKLIYCDLRISENYTKILYLVINSIPKKLKRKKSYRSWNLRKTPSGLKHSQFRDANFRYAVNLLYLDLPKLKKQVSAKLLPLAKQKINSAFYKKTRYKTWINFLAKIKNVRAKNTLNYKRHNVRFAPILNSKLNFQQSLIYKVNRLKREINVLNRFFATLKLKKALTKHNILFYKTQLAKLKNKFLKLNAAIANYSRTNITTVIIPSKKVKFKSTSPRLNINLRAAAKTIRRKNNFKKTLKIKKFSTLKSKKKKSKQKSLPVGKTKRTKFKAKAKTSLVSTKSKAVRRNSKKVLRKVRRTKIKVKKLSKSRLRLRMSKTNKIVKSINNILLNKYNSTVQRKLLTRMKKAQFLLRRKEQRRSRMKSRNINAISLIEDNETEFKPTILSDKAHKHWVHHVISIYALYLKENSLINNHRTFSKFINLLKAQNVRHFSKKSQFNHRNVNTNFNSKLNKTLALNYPSNLNRVHSPKLKKKVRGRRNKFKFSILKRIRLKHKMQIEPRTFSKKHYNLEVNSKKVSNLIKNFAKKYKKVEAKLKKKHHVKKAIWKFRESFRQNYRTHATTLAKYQYKMGLQKVLKKYFKMDFEVKVVRPLAQFKNLKFWRLVYNLRRFQRNNKNKKKFVKKTIRKLKKKSTKHGKTFIALRERYILNGNRIKRFAKFNKKLRKLNIRAKNTYVFRKKANLFKRLRSKELLNFTQSRLSNVRRSLLIRSFMPIASLFIKFLDPQLLADHIAKEFEKTKHHKSIIYGLSHALRALPFARGKGYYIAISGRINSSDKSRSYFLKRNVLIRQDFSRKVNFASSQARARIGSFGIKVWVFY